MAEDWELQSLLENCGDLHKTQSAPRAQTSHGEFDRFSVRHTECTQSSKAQTLRRAASGPRHREGSPFLAGSRLLIDEAFHSTDFRKEEAISKGGFPALAQDTVAGVPLNETLSRALAISGESSSRNHFFEGCIPDQRQSAAPSQVSSAVALGAHKGFSAETLEFQGPILGMPSHPAPSSNNVQQTALPSLLKAVAEGWSFQPHAECLQASESPEWVPGLSQPETSRGGSGATQKGQGQGGLQHCFQSAGVEPHNRGEDQLALNREERRSAIASQLGFMTASHGRTLLLGPTHALSADTGQEGTAWDPNTIRLKSRLWEQLEKGSGSNSQVDSSDSHRGMHMQQQQQQQQRQQQQWQGTLKQALGLPGSRHGWRNPDVVVGTGSPWLQPRNHGTVGIESDELLPSERLGNGLGGLLGSGVERETLLRCIAAMGTGAHLHSAASLDTAAELPMQEADGGNPSGWGPFRWNSGNSTSMNSGSPPWNAPCSHVPIQGLTREGLGNAGLIMHRLSQGVGGSGDAGGGGGGGGGGRKSLFPDQEDQLALTGARQRFGTEPQLNASDRRAAVGWKSHHAGDPPLGGGAAAGVTPLVSDEGGPDELLRHFGEADSAQEANDAADLGMEDSDPGDLAAIDSDGKSTRGGALCIRSHGIGKQGKTLVERERRRRIRVKLEELRSLVHCRGDTASVLKRTLTYVESLSAHVAKLEEKRVLLSMMNPRTGPPSRTRDI